ncbi:hypothetical protein BD324DRAFT_652294 [Kockovaella imperatae]|uniref:DNA polymerase kappa n=1 Tax=Kockovaella imperatae TaxID=4999 RepID=A0A1Y1UCH6_9TREE|nr:hypothetical protein BD324DRAFT_652294 [Kockovaella imperatae]ORX35753.1 hypothetical protein BD324DRAFT_652294 [Kockovaella imperatae]
MLPSPSSSIGGKGEGKLEKDDPVDHSAENQLSSAEKKKRSFERSLAGPRLQLDQTEINHIIAEASRGSKFYNNQVRKDDELNRKIAWFQAKRDELLKMAQPELLAVEAERILAEVEATRDLSQTIVHVDMDAFYASVEVKHDPSLKGKPFGVGQGVLTTASYEARKFGCRSGMAGFIAKRLCPQIILVPLNFDRYIDASDSVRRVLLDFDSNLMMASLDEGYLNITQYMDTHAMTAGEVVSHLRNRVEEATGLTVSAGIAPNRMLAKICSDKNKPNGQFELQFDRVTITRFMRDMPVRKIPGFGRVTERCLEGLGVETCGDIWKNRVELLVMDHWFGFKGLCKAYLGIADNTVQPGKREERKSVGCERTFRDKTDDEDILNTLADIADELCKDLERLQYAGKTVTVKYKLHTFEISSSFGQKIHLYQGGDSAGKFLLHTVAHPQIAQELLKRDLPLKIRLLGIRLSTLKDLTVVEKGIKNYFTTNMATPSEEESPIPADVDQSPTLPSAPALDTICPICDKNLGSATSNAQLNAHIDECLNREEAPRPAKKPKVKPGGKTMLDWVTRTR